MYLVEHVVSKQLCNDREAILGTLQPLGKLVKVLPALLVRAQHLHNLVVLVAAQRALVVVGDAVPVVRVPTQKVHHGQSQRAWALCALVVLLQHTGASE